MYFSRKLGNRLAAILTIGLVVAGFASSAGADTLYTEYFPNASPGINLSMNAVGWNTYISSSCTDVSSTGNNVAGANGIGGVGGFGYYKPADYTGGIALASTSTTEFSAIDQSKYSSLTFSWYLSVGATSAKSQLAVDVGGTWYVSKDVFQNSDTVLFADGGVNKKSLTLSSASGWYQLTVSPGSSLAVGTTLYESLPTDNIVAAGLLGTGTATSPSPSIRFDNFEISGTAIPEPTSLILLGMAILGLVAYAWRKSK